jgi:hypothetical protein
MCQFDTTFFFKTLVYLFAFDILVQHFSDWSFGLRSLVCPQERTLGVRLMRMGNEPSSSKL